MNIFRRSSGHPRHGSSNGGGGGGGGSEEQKRNRFGRISKLFLNEKVIRVFVSLPEGSTLAISADVSSTIEQVRAEAIRRATAMGVQIPRDSVLRTTEGSRGVVLLGEDLVVDALDLVENHTFVLWSEVSTASISGVDSMSTIIVGGCEADGLEVYIRWITARLAMEHPCLQSIPVDMTPVRSSATIAELRDIAIHRVYMARDSTEERPHLDTTVELFLFDCHLATSDPDTTLADLVGKTTPEKPLNLFVVLRSKRNATAERPQNAWGFTSSDRGVATFQTSLKMLLREISEGRTDLENVLEVLWEVTHFPPALIAFQQLNDKAGRIDIGLPPGPLAVFASCFRDASAQMVPPWITTSPVRVLEASRQIFSWLRSLHSEASKALGSHQALVHRVQLREPQPGCSVGIPGRFDYNEDVKVKDSSGVSTDSTVLVSKEKDDDVNAKTLAVALKGSYELSWNYYFKLPSTAGQPLEHQRASALHPADFDNLLMTTNQDDAFRMIGPLKLASSSPPFITLDREGYVSIYGTRDIECEDKYPYTWNAINGIEILKGVEPGQFLLQKVTPVISQCKKEGTWEVDAWDEDSIATDTRKPEEAVVICFDRSSSMDMGMGTSWMERPVATEPGGELSRLSEVKEVFQQLVARIAAYNLPTHLGLVTFSSRTEVRIQQALTPVLYDFKDRVMDIRAQGSTAIWDAIVKATDMLAAYKTKHPGAKRRIIVLTDGENNDSRFDAPSACTDLYSYDIVLDAIVIGTRSTDDLFKMAKHTGGYAFNPTTRNLLFQIPLLETFIDIKTRPDIAKEYVSPKKYLTSSPKRPDMVSPLDFPPCRPHRSQTDTFISLRDASRFMSASLRSSRMGSATQSSRASIFSGTSISSWGGITAGSGATPSSGASGAGRLFLSEIRAAIDNPHEFMDIYVSETNMGFWKVVMQGPPASPYQAGTFVLYIELGDGFPRSPPTIRFITPILHPNITKACF
ncbi:hypothetical protein GP486_003619 [Trichoglossum hirsutum]|uniref:UBC core domain-containing protein n=1 Tax=Trichoglossum hirsutum TaxID=265104 RepID=A0A9P8RQX3_9PEZI|nr:hypothetical protein GP486_003619 [Trichoglossum hirsutum]